MRKSLLNRTSCAAISMLKISIVQGEKLVIYSTGTMKKQTFCSFALAVPHPSGQGTQSNCRCQTVICPYLQKSASLPKVLFLPASLSWGFLLFPHPEYPHLGVGNRGVAFCIPMAVSFTSLQSRRGRDISSLRSKCAALSEIADSKATRNTQT